MNSFVQRPDLIVPDSQSVQPSNELTQQNIGEGMPDNVQHEFAFSSLQTTLKDSGVGKTDQDRLELIKSLQLFDSPEWLSLNFIDIQKSYLSKPGFVELETNEDLKPFDKNKFLPSCERTLAALSNAFLLQRGILQNNIMELLTWVKNLKEIQFEEFSGKVKELFCEDKEYNKTSNDIMQIICGKRATIINNRRTELLKSVQNSFTADKFRRIPPSSEHLFEPSQFTTLLDREGGPSKVFVKTQPPKKNDTAFKSQGRFQGKGPFFQPFKANIEPSGSSKGNTSHNHNSRGKRKHDTKRHDRRRGDTKRRRYD